MAQLGIIAGVRGNLEALGAVLAELRRQHVLRVLCAGDVVGYNADPAECAAALRDFGAACVAGRHDLIAVRRLGFEGCSDAEVHSLKRTRQSLTREAAAWLGSLPTHEVVDGTLALVHAGIRDIGQDMADVDDVRENAGHLRYDFPGARVCFFGRGDGPRAYEVDGNVVHPVEGARVLSLDRSRMHFIHPGCVDAQAARAAQARRFAEFAIFDTLDWAVEFARVPYDAASTEAKAAVFGYRMTGLAAGLYALQRRVLRLRAGTLPRNGAGAPGRPPARGRRGSASTP